MEDKIGAFKEIDILPEDFEILNCPNCKDKIKARHNHYILCGNIERRELYLMCVYCGKKFQTNVKSNLDGFSIEDSFADKVNECFNSQSEAKKK